MKKSAQTISKSVIEEIMECLTSIDSHGSVEIFVQDRKITQITTRNIRKTDKKTIDKTFSVY